MYQNYTLSLLLSLMPHNVDYAEQFYIIKVYFWQVSEMPLEHQIPVKHIHTHRHNLCRSLRILLHDAQTSSRTRYSSTLLYNTREYTKQKYVCS